MNENLIINKEIKEISNILDISKECFFFIQVSKQLENIKKGYDEKIIPDDNHISILNEEIQRLENIIKLDEVKDNIQILPSFYDRLINLKEMDKSKSDYSLKIKKILDEYKGEKNITLNNIKNIYQENYNSNLSIMTISRVLRYHLDIHYRKTVIKNPKLNEKNYVLMGIGFIVGIIKCLLNNIHIIYIDECGFELENKNLRMWRNNNQEITGGSKHNIKKRINLILAIDNSEILIGHYYKNQTISSTEFLCFLKDLIKTVNEKKYMILFLF